MWLWHRGQTILPFTNKRISCGVLNGKIGFIFLHLYWIGWVFDTWTWTWINGLCYAQNHKIKPTLNRRFDIFWEFFVCKIWGYAQKPLTDSCEEVNNCGHIKILFFAVLYYATNGSMVKRKMCKRWPLARNMFFIHCDITHLTRCSKISERPTLPFESICGGSHVNEILVQKK